MDLAGAQQVALLLTSLRRMASGLFKVCEL